MEYWNRTKAYFAECPTVVMQLSSHRTLPAYEL